MQRAAQRNDLTWRRAYKLSQGVISTLPAIRSRCRSGMRQCVASSTTCSTRFPRRRWKELTLKREAISDDALEARMRFTLFWAGSRAA